MAEFPPGKSIEPFGDNELCDGTRSLGSSHPDRVKVKLMVEAEVDRQDGFTDEEYANVAKGILTKAMWETANTAREDFWVYCLVDGEVAFKNPVVMEEG
jgi:hypothetical protein